MSWTILLKTSRRDSYRPGAMRHSLSIIWRTPAATMTLYARTWVIPVGWPDRAAPVISAMSSKALPLAARRSLKSSDLLRNFSVVSRFPSGLPWMKWNRVLSVVFMANLRGYGWPRRRARTTSSTLK